MAETPFHPRRKSLWKPLQPVVVRDPLLYRLAKDHLLLVSVTTGLLIDCARGVYRPHRFGGPKKLQPFRLDGDVLIDMAGDFKSFNRRRWEIYEQLGQLGIFIEVSSLEYEICEVKNDAYDRDDAYDWFAFINGHAVPVCYSIPVIIRALQNREPRIRLLAAIALGYLVRHRGHRCYTRSEECALDEAWRFLKEVSARLNDNEMVEKYLHCLERS
jgi:hypothetical protein